MLGHLGFSEFLVLAVIGLIVFGPERLPKAAADAARMLRQLRQMARGAASDLKAELGPEMADINLRSLNPRTFVEDALRDEAPVKPTPSRPTAAAGAPLGRTERPPYDPDAT